METVRYNALSDSIFGSAICSALGSWKKTRELPGVSLAVTDHLTVIRDPMDPRFDLEAYLTKVQAESP